MKALMSSGINSIHATLTRSHSRLIPSSSVKFTNNFAIRHRLLMKRQQKQKYSSMKPQASSTLGQLDNTSPSKEVVEMWRNADSVCFDVDRTVCEDEGIDELAEFCGARKAVAQWTARAIGGSVSLLAARLSRFKPSFDQLPEFVHKMPPKISLGIAEFVNKLKAKNNDVYLISEGFRQMINARYYLMEFYPSSIALQT